MLAASNVLPDNAGYVVAAYLVFLALILVYVVIMAYKLIKLQRDVSDIAQLADRALDEARGEPTPVSDHEETPA